MLVSWMTPDFCNSTVKLGLDPTGIKTDLYQVLIEKGSSIYDVTHFLTDSTLLDLLTCFLIRGLLYCRHKIISLFPIKAVTSLWVTPITGY